jgi:hypothetical protein
MMQSCASAAKLRGDGPILNRGSRTMCKVGLPPPRFVIRSSAMMATMSCRSSVVMLAGNCSCRPHRQAHWRLASSDELPEGYKKLPGQGHNHGLAQTATAACSSCPIPHGQRAAF